MEKLLALNGVSDVVTVSPAALSDRAVAAAPLFLPSDSVLSTLDSVARAARRRPSVHLEREVPVRRSTTGSKRSTGPRSIAPIDLIKIDVEGTEERVLRGMTRTLSRHPSVTIMCETSARQRRRRDPAAVPDSPCGRSIVYPFAFRQLSLLPPVSGRGGPPPLDPAGCGGTWTG